MPVNPSLTSCAIGSQTFVGCNSSCAITFNGTSCELASEVACLTPPVNPTAPCPSPPLPPPFTCVDGQWISDTNVNLTDLIIPSSAGIVVSGSLTVTSQLTFTGLQSSIVISGCANIPNTVTISLSSSDMDNLRSGTRVTLISSNCSSESDVGSARIVISADNSCKKTTATTRTSVQGDFVALLSVDSKACNIWWIVLVCVVGATIIALFVFILLATFHSVVKAAIRPFWVRKVKEESFNKIAPRIAVQAT